MSDGDAGAVLPTGTRLLHIGPPESGMGALQGAFHAHRGELEGQGVHYAGPNRQPLAAAHVISGTPSPYANGKVPPERRWRDLVREVEQSTAARVVISSEGFADAEPAGVERVVRDLDRSRLHVVVTLRPLAAILPSQWQQDVQAGMVLAYADWLEAVFNEPAGKVSTTFWHRHRHDRLVARWAAAVGPDRVSVIVGDAGQGGAEGSDRQLRAFEELLGLATGTLVPEANPGDRSLTLPEVESLRAFNAAFRAEGLGTRLYDRVVRFGAAALLLQRTPAEGEPRIETPDWALERAASTARDIVDGIRGAGVRIIGDLHALTVGPAARASAATTYDVDATWADIGATMALGIVLASGLARGEASKAWSQIPWPDGPLAAGRRPPRARVEPLELARVSTPLLGLILARRFLAAAGSRLRPARRAS